jgi:hypothetical protein
MFKSRSQGYLLKREEMGDRPRLWNERLEIDRTRNISTKTHKRTTEFITGGQNKNKFTKEWPKTGWDPSSLSSRAEPPTSLPSHATVLFKMLGPCNLRQCGSFSRMCWAHLKNCEGRIRRNPPAESAVRRPPNPPEFSSEKITGTHNLVFGLEFYFPFSPTLSMIITSFIRILIMVTLFAEKRSEESYALLVPSLRVFRSMERKFGDFRKI